MDSYSHRVSLRRSVVPSQEKPVWRGHSCPRANPTRQLKVRKIDVNLVLLYPEVSYSQHDQVQDGFSGRAGL